MSFGDSSTSIANNALAMLGEEPIPQLSPVPQNRRGRLCAQFYDTSRRAMLAASPWREAKRQFQAAAAVTVPLFGGGAAYPVPADFIRLYDIHGEGMRWQLANLENIGVCVVTRAGAPLDEWYIFDLKDCTMMNPLLVKAIAADMAVMLAMPLTRDGGARDRALADRDWYLSRAQSVSAQQATPPVFDNDVLLRARR